MHERCVWIYLIGIHNNEPQLTANEQLFIHELIQSHWTRTDAWMDGWPRRGGCCCVVIVSEP